MRTSSAIMIIVELIFISFLACDPLRMHPKEGFANIEKKAIAEQLSRTQVFADKVMLFAVLWMVASACAFWCFFASATTSAALSLPLFIFGYRLSEAGFASAFIWGLIALIFASSIMHGFHMNAWIHLSGGNDD